MDQITRVSIPPAADEALIGWGSPASMTHAPANHQVHTGVTRWGSDHQGGGTSTQDYASATVSRAGSVGGSVIATRDTVAGHDTVELIPGNAGSRTHLRTAVEAGLIREVFPGRYEDVQDVAQAQQRLQGTPTDRPAAPADPGAEVFSSVEDAAFSQVIAPLPQHAYDAAIAAGTVAAVAGGDLTQAAQVLTQNARMEPAQAAEMVQAGHGYFERVVARAVAPLGIVGERKEQFYEWARSRPDQLRNALHALLLTRDPAQFKTLGADFNVMTGRR